MRVFLPHQTRDGNTANKLSGASSPREDKRRQEESVDERKVAAKKQRQQSSATPEDAQLKDPMGGGGKLYPARKERELLEVKKRSSEQNSGSNTTDSVASVNDNRQAADLAGAASIHSDVAALVQPRSGAAASRPRQNDCRNAKMPADDKCNDDQLGSLKRECSSPENPAEDQVAFDNEANNTISIGAEWDPPSTSPTATSTFARSSATTAASSSIAVKSIEEDDPATFSKADLTEDQLLSQYAHSLRATHTPSLEITPMQGDGNCLFRAISLQVYGSEDMHCTVRKQCLDFMEAEETHFKEFVAEPYELYIARKKCDGVHGNHAEIQAASELYNRRIEVYVPPKMEPINIFQQEEDRGNANSIDNPKSTSGINHPIRLLYMDGNHYDALIDPLVPTAGLGLGLPDLQPGLADKLQIDQAKRESSEIIQSNMERKMQLALEESKRAQEQKEEEDIERVLRESCVEVVGGKGLRTEREEVEDAFQKKALYMSEMEAADFDIEQAVLTSSLESYRQLDQDRKPAGRSVGAGRRGRHHSSPSYSNSRSLRSSSSSPVHSTLEANYSTHFSAASSHYTSSYPPAAAAASTAASASVASFPRARSSSPSDQNSGRSDSAAAASSSAHASSDEYPPSVQELVMNGFQLSKVLHAYDLIGDDFDGLLSFLLSSKS